MIVAKVESRPGRRRVAWGHAAGAAGRRGPVRGERCVPRHVASRANGRSRAGPRDRRGSCARALGTCPYTRSNPHARCAAARSARSTEGAGERGARWMPSMSSAASMPRSRCTAFVRPPRGLGTSPAPRPGCALRAHPTAAGRVGRRRGRCECRSSLCRLSAALGRSRPWADRQDGRSETSVAAGPP